MFGMGFLEIFLILIVAIIALGPEKLPTAAVEVVKFFRKFKSGVEDAKSTLNHELNMDEMRREAQSFQSSLTDVTSTIDETTSSITDNINSTLNNDQKSEAKPAKDKKEKKGKKEKVSFQDKEIK